MGDNLKGFCVLELQRLKWERQEVKMLGRQLDPGVSSRAGYGKGCTSESKRTAQELS